MHAHGLLLYIDVREMERNVVFVSRKYTSKVDFGKYPSY